MIDKMKLIEFSKLYVKHGEAKKAYLLVFPATPAKHAAEYAYRLMQKKEVIDCINYYQSIDTMQLMKAQLDNINTLTSIIESDSKPADKINAVKLLNTLYQEINQDHNSPVSKIGNNINGLLVASETKTSTKSITFNANMTELSHTTVMTSNDNDENNESNTLDYKVQAIDI